MYNSINKEAHMCFNTQFYKMGFKRKSIIMNVGDLRVVKTRASIKRHL